MAKKKRPLFNNKLSFQLSYFKNVVLNSTFFREKLLTSGMRHPKHFLTSNRSLIALIARNYLMDSAEKCIFAEWKVIFTGDEHKFTVHEHMFTGDEHKFTAYKYKIVKCVANFVLQELPKEVTGGKKIVCPKMQTYSKRLSKIWNSIANSRSEEINI